jgi:apolipoprotein N-acyltransferase
LTAGILLALSFPKYGHPAVAWIALVPLLVAVSGRLGPGMVAAPARSVPPLRAFLLGLIAGLVYFVGTVYWTSSVVATYGQLAMPVAAFAMLLLAAYLALYVAVTALILSWLIARAGARALFLTPAAWVATEFLRGYLFGGFPWVPLGNSQVTVLPVAQLASVLGVYGLSALVAFVNGAIAYAVLTTGRTRLKTVAAVVVLLAATAGWGAWRIGDGRHTREGTPIRVGLVQGNIEQSVKWRPEEAYRIFTTYVAMTRDVARRGAQYVIWPESSTPFAFEGNPSGEKAVRDLAIEVGLPILFGSDQTVIDRSVRLQADQPANDRSVRLEADHPLVERHYNAAFQLAPDGMTSAVYRKIHLVPFGEFVPLADWLTFFPPLVQTLAGFAPFTAGESMIMLPVGKHLASTAICYEVVYPSLVREAVAGGSELLTTITNDAWYGHSSAPFQHFEMAAMRAIEHGRYMARAANTGISGVIDPYGRVVARSAIFEQVGLVEEVRFLTGRTVYTAIGDVVAYMAIAMVVIALIFVRRSEPRT